MNGFTFYNNYYELIKYLKEKDRLELYDAIFEYMFESKEPNFTDIKKGIWMNIKMPLDTSKSKGGRGGAPTGNSNAKKQPKNNQKTTKKQPNENQIEVKKQTNNIFLFLISNFLFLKDRGLLRGKIEEWLEYKKQRKDKPYTEIGFKKLLSQIENNVNKYGESAVIELIDECMSNNYQGIIFDKLKVKKSRTQELPHWFDKKTESRELNGAEEKEFDELLEGIDF